MKPLALSVTAAEAAYWGTFGIWAVGERVLWFRDLRLKSWNARQDRGSTLWVLGGAIAGGVQGYLPFFIPGILVQSVIATTVAAGWPSAISRARFGPVRTPLEESGRTSSTTWVIRS